MARRQADPHRQRLVAAGLLTGLAVLGGGILFVLAGGLGRPVASPTGGASLTAAPTGGSPVGPTVGPTGSAAASPSATQGGTPGPPTSGPTTTPMPPTSGQPSPTASAAAPTPSGAAAGPRRELLFDRLGIDNISAPEAMARLITFAVDGPGEVSLALQRLSVAQVTMCLWQGSASTAPPAGQCRVMSDGMLERTAPAGRSTWTASIIGAQAGRSPWARLRLRFPAHQPAVELTQFRFQGLPNPDYNGLTAQLTPSSAGELSLAVEWSDDAGGSYPYRVRIDDLSAPLVEPYFEEGTGDGFDVLAPVVADHDYLIFFENRSQDFHERVIYRAMIGWP